jgi:hypothetical protein
MMARTGLPLRPDHPGGQFLEQIGITLGELDIQPFIYTQLKDGCGSR